MLWMCSLRQFSDRWSCSTGMVRCTTFRWHFKGMLALFHLCTSGCPVTDLMEDVSSSKPSSCWGGWALPEPGRVHKPAWQMANEIASRQRAVQRNLPKGGSGTSSRWAACSSGVMRGQRVWTWVLVERRAARAGEAGWEVPAPAAGW